MRKLRGVWFFCALALICGCPCLGKTISGTVTHSSSGVENVLMSAEDSEGTVAAAAYTDGDGDYALDGLGSEVYTLYCFPTLYYGTPDSRSVSLVSVSTSDQDYSLTQAGLIAGRTFDSNGTTGLSGVTVFAMQDSGSCQGSAQSGYGGYYTITNLLAGTYTVSTRKANYGFDDLTNVSVTAGQQTGSQNFTAYKAKISGTVEITDGGTAVAGAMVMAYDTSEGEIAAFATSDSNGDYELTGLKVQSYTLYAGKTGYRGQKLSSVSATEVGATGQDFVACTGSISGTVEYNSSGLSGATVIAQCVDEDMDANELWGENPVQATTDGSGDFALPYLPNGTYRVSAYKSGYEIAFRGSDSTVSGGGAVTGADITITGTNPGSISGTVTDSGSNAIEFGVLALEKSGDSTFVMTVEPDTGGDYSFGSLSAGTYSVRTICGFGSYVQEKATGISVSSGQSVTGQDFELLSETGSISGTVLDDTTEDPIEGAYVEARSSGSDYFGFAATDSSGDYEIEWLGAATDYTVTAEASGYETGTQSSVSVTQNQETSNIDFDLVAE